MIDRYALPELRELFGERRRLQLWLRIELLAAEALHETGVIPTEDWERIRSALAGEEVDPERAPSCVASPSGWGERVAGCTTV